MKKRTKLIIGLCVILSMIIGGGTMAWFTSNPIQVINTLKTGTVAVTLNDFTGDIKDVNPGDSYDKKISVTSKGTLETYVRVKLTPIWDKELSIDSVIPNLGSDWVYKDGYYYYKHILKEGETTTLLLDGITFNGSKITNEYQGASFTIDVKAEGVQASHYAFRDVWGIDGNEMVPAVGVDPWKPIN